jgi:ATP-dependent RNA helicase DDX49/DBP8
MAATTKDFASLGVDRWLVQSLSAMAIRKPTSIQAACIKPILEGTVFLSSAPDPRLTSARTGQDCIGGSRTGSGKTVAFAVPILQAWARDPFGVFAVILTPTR